MANPPPHSHEILNQRIGSPYQPGRGLLHPPNPKGPTMRKIIASTTIAASLLGGGAAAIVFVPAVAGAQDEVEQGEPGGIGAVLGELVTSGILTQDQANAVADAMEEARDDGTLGGPRGPRGPQGQHGEGQHGPRGPRGGAIQALGDLGIDAETVRQGLEDGLNLGEIAAANGSSTDALADALVAQMAERLETAVENGRLDETEAAEKATEFETKVDDIVNGDFEPGKGHRPGGPRGGHRPGDGPAGDAEAPEESGA